MAKITDEIAVKLIESFQSAVRAVAWAEAGGDDADPEDVQGADAARAALMLALTAEHVEQERGAHHSESNAEAELRRGWTAQGVSRERQDELISQIAAKAAPGARIGPFTVRDNQPNR